MNEESLGRLGRECLALQDEVFRRTAGVRVAPGLTRLGVGFDGAAEGLAEAMSRVRHSVCSLQRTMTLRDELMLRDLSLEVEARGVVRTAIVAPDVLVAHPLATSFRPTLRVGPVFIPLLVGDRSILVLAGAPSPSGKPTVWASTEGELLRRGLQVCETTERLSVPALTPGEDPPFTARQVEVAVLLMGGATDQTIAKQLGISTRTVSAEVRRLVQGVGATSRAAAVAILSGVAAQE